jgi:hypothetical protein
LSQVTDKSEQAHRAGRHRAPGELASVQSLDFISMISR